MAFFLMITFPCSNNLYSKLLEQERGFPNSDKIEYEIMPKEVKKGDTQGMQIDNFSGVSCNPLTLEETIQGAKNRAKNAYEHAKERTRHLQFWCGNRSRDVSCK